MKLSFRINYQTRWGEGLYILGSSPELGGWNPALAKPMNYTYDGDWQADIELSAMSQEIEYRYCVKRNNRIIREEWNHNHHLTVHENIPSYVLLDNWQAIPSDLSFYTSAFTKSVFAHQEQKNEAGTGGMLVLKLFAPKVQSNQFVVISGNQPILGNWDTSGALRLNGSQFPEWRVEIPVNQIKFPLEYKFFVSDNEQQTPLYWESINNRTLNPFPLSEQGVTCLSGLFFSDSLPLWRTSGSVIPVFSLRSEKSFGVGDLGDLKLMVDWVRKTHQRVIQILPVNDTTMTKTWQDSYPYSAISIFAIHPIYMDLNGMGKLNHPDRVAFYIQKQIELNNKTDVDYEEVYQHKIAYASEYFKQEQDTILNDPAFIEFVNENKIWLVPYACFCYYRDQYQTADFNQWGEHAVYNKAVAYQLCDESSEFYPEIAFIYFQQYILHIQFKEVSDYARKNGVILKGDFPIGINRTSVEAWTEPAYFNMNGQAGAPPDDFSASGQNWGLPTYNWDLMEQDGYSWWKKRFHKLGDYFDCFRIDHILGFFRIWEIPLEYVQGLCGHFNPALPYSRDEIGSFGLYFDEGRFTTPHIHRNFLYELLGDLTEEVINSYLAQSSSNHFVLKDFCDTQAKIEKIFADKTDDFSFRIKKGLMYIANEVLFLRDPYQTDKFHPRISANQSYIYRELSPGDRYNFDRLYQDFFYHRHNEFWKGKALQRLTPLVTGTEMLVCGEDLGMIPETVPAVMNELQILSLEVERMPKAIDREFTDMYHLPYLSVCTTSTHDMSPLRNWWKEDRGKTQRYYNNVLQRWGAAPEECTADIATYIVINHLKTTSMLCIIPVQDWFAMDDAIKNPFIEGERINVPANPKHYWRYRMHITLEDLLKAEEFNQKIINLLEESNRK
ncbi:MAG: 4-alpha-glucanotransferase [Tannerellaceae bacterium]|nr:4-alpha-glucanotransferase [Tannerellaceae bacterium]